MIPGKLFFQSIKIPQHISFRYEVFLILNSIYYDKIKPFQTKYMCLTVNDLLQVQFYLKNSQAKKVEDKQNEENEQQIYIKNPIVLKLSIPQSYKLMIQNKNIDLKFYLKEQHQQIKINFLFQPVASFSRKKLAASLNSPLKMTHKHIFSPGINKFQNQSKQLYNQSSRENKQKKKQVKISPLKLLSTLGAKNNYNQELFSDVESKNIRSSRFAYEQIFQNHKNQGITNRNDLSNDRVSEKNDQDDKIKNQYSNLINLSNYNSEKPSQLDTLESLAYQREKILGQLFGKFNKNYK